MSARCGMKIRANGAAIYGGPPTRQKRKRRRSPESASSLLTERSGGSDRMLPPSVRSIPERSKSPGIATGRIRSQLTERSQSPVDPVYVFFLRLDAGTPSDRTLNNRVWSLHRSRFTSCELTGRWTSESGAASGHSFPTNLQSPSCCLFPIKS